MIYHKGTGFLYTNYTGYLANLRTINLLQLTSVVIAQLFVKAKKRH